MNKNIYLKLRLERQHFTKPAGKKEYGVLFKQMSPVLCVYWSCRALRRAFIPRGI